MPKTQPTDEPAEPQTPVPTSPTQPVDSQPSGHHEAEKAIEMEPKEPPQS
ncbi:MAG TPA: hypothetical protein VHX59_26715 [Mycobacteriales bacterium]|jgi:hypothetical protein|nr:hypothetical protein [Mycobacteriales bacterium]